MEIGEAYLKSGNANPEGAVHLFTIRAGRISSPRSYPGSVYELPFIRGELFRNVDCFIDVDDRNIFAWSISKSPTEGYCDPPRSEETSFWRA